MWGKYSQYTHSHSHLSARAHTHTRARTYLYTQYNCVIHTLHNDISNDSNKIIQKFILQFHKMYFGICMYDVFNASMYVWMYYSQCCSMNATISISFVLYSMIIDKKLHNIQERILPAVTCIEYIFICDTISLIIGFIF